MTTLPVSLVILFGLSVSPLAILFVIAVAPTVFLLWFFYNSDRYKRESKKLLLVTFFLGALMIGPAVLIELFLRLFIPGGPGLIGIFIYFLLGVALVEETLKVVAVRIYAYRSPRFNEPMDGLVLGVAAALGFATVENVLYVLNFGFITAIVRAVVSVPSHALYGAISGFYLGEAKYKRKPYLVLKGLSIAIVLHGTFDTVATILPSILGVIALAGFVLVVYFRIVRGEIRKAEGESPFKPAGLFLRCTLKAISGRITLMIYVQRMLNIATCKIGKVVVAEKSPFSFLITKHRASSSAR